MTLYLDDSGTRNPDRHSKDELPRHGFDWFALGGVLIRDTDRDELERRHAEFCERWGIQAPLHSCEIRSKKENFKWLGTLDKFRHKAFVEDLSQLVTASMLTATACVVDRPGYNARYRERYGESRWSLCRTAFNVVVERAAKYARRHDCRLRVFVERADKKTDHRLEDYYEGLRTKGSPFNAGRSAKYAPLTPDEFRFTLYEFRTKVKASPLIQFADLCLWPICMAGYQPENRAYRAMSDAGILMDGRLPVDAVEREGIKYSCWELATPETQKPG